MRLHVGCGRERLEGWINVDIQVLPGVDLVADVTRPLKVAGLEAVYAEHFLEHLEIDAAVEFLRNMHAALAPDGAIRLSTPNLDWVWITHYRRDARQDEKTGLAVMLNRAFRGWQHRFLWNQDLLGRALAACGFVDLRWHRYGESERPLLRNLERHATYHDVPELPHVLIAEAAKGPEQPEAYRALRELIESQYLAHVAGV